MSPYRYPLDKGKQGYHLYECIDSCPGPVWAKEEITGVIDMDGWIALGWLLIEYRLILFSP